MTHPRFFGFGSLVNCATHKYPNTRPARLSGWRREWIPTIGGEIAHLSVHPVPGAMIEGLTADVPGADWAALDARETGYARQIVTDLIPDETTETWVYAIPQTNRAETAQYILQSYLDVVMQGFYRQSGLPGLHAFFETTDGWDVEVRNDRNSPLYPRAQVLSDDETALFDATYAEFTRGL